MRKLLEPKMMIDHYSDFDGERFIKEGYDTIFIDLDNTLAPYYEKRIDEAVYKFLDSLRKIGFKVFVISNNSEERVGNYFKDTDINYLFYALKPFKKGYKKAINDFNLNPKKIVAMGDQMLTDVIGANRMGFYSIYVKPIIDKDSITTKLNRKIEKFLFKYVVKK